MVCRILAIPLAVVVAIAVFLCPVLGTSLPENDTEGIVTFGVNVTFPPLRSFSAMEFPFGTLNGFYYSVVDSDEFDYPTTVQSNFSIQNFSAATLYVGVKSGNYTSGLISFPELEPYHNSDLDFVYNESSYVFPAYQIEANSDGSSSYYLYRENYQTRDLTIQFLCFENVPVGNYEVVNNNSLSTAAFTSAYCAVYVVSSDPMSNPGYVVDEFVSGNISFPDAVTGVGNATINNVNNASTPDQKQFELARGQFELTRLVIESNLKSVQVIENTVIPGFNNIVQNYVTGSISIEESINNLHSEYINSLSSVDTPEQGTFLNTSYQISLKKLEIESRQKAFEKLDSAVSDDQLSEADDYYQSEEELIDMFQVAEFESALDFQLWFNTLPPSETIEYKKFFDYLLNDSPIRIFLVVPISLILVRILLGTHLVLSRGGDHSSSSVFNRDFVSGSRYDDPFTGD